MTALLRRANSGEVDALDLFCGFGGSSQGIHAAGATVRGAANHNPLALECHSANFRNTDHWRADLSDPESADYVDPASLPPVTFLWASPSCKYHSIANAKKLYQEGPQGQLFSDGEPFDHERYAASERSRVSMLCPLRYAAKHRPEIVAIENVVEAACWGPARDGSTFRWWLREWELLGYEYEALFLNSMFFPPCPQSRDRMYVVFWRRGNTRPDLDFRPKACCTSDRCQGAVVEAVQWWKEPKAAWPLPRWGKYRAQYLYKCPDCAATVEPLAWPAYSAIDWTNLGIALGDRERFGLKPLAPATMERIRRGLLKFRGGPPLLIPAKGNWGVDRPVTGPMPTQSTQQERAIVVDGATHVVPLRTHGTARHLVGDLPTLVAGNIGQGLAFVVKNNGSIDEAGYRALPVTDPFGALTASPTQAIASAGIHFPVGGNAHERPGQTRGRDLADPLFTLTATQQFGFAHQPAVISLRGGGSTEAGQHSVLDVLATLSAGGRHHAVSAVASEAPGAIVLPWLEQWRSDPVAVTDQMATVMSHLRHSLAVAEWDHDPGPITDEELARVRFRMLEPDPELRRAMAFQDDYILLGNKSQMTAGLGNAVTPTVATAVTERCLDTLAA